MPKPLSPIYAIPESGQQKPIGNGFDSPVLPTCCLSMRCTIYHVWAAKKVWQGNRETLWTTILSRKS
eukprot:14756045-Ditylum_brightwellii.AAC.2